MNTSNATITTVKKIYRAHLTNDEIECVLADYLRKAFGLELGEQKIDFDVTSDGYFRGADVTIEISEVTHEES